MRFPLRHVAYAALALAIVGCGDGHSASSGSSASQFDGAAFPPGINATDFTLPDQTGRRMSLSAQRGHVVALTFLWSNCRSCLLVAQQIRGALDELGPSADVRTVFMSTAPRVDTRARVERFLASTSLAGRAAYLTGGVTQLRPVWRAYRVIPASAGRTAAEDAITVLLIDRTGAERVAFGIEQITPEGLSHDIHLLLAG